MSESIEFYNFPKNLSLDAYNSAREELIIFFKKNTAVTAIYEYGKVAAPGVSDLDIMVVVDANAPLKLGLSSFSDLTIGLIGAGNVIYIDTNTFENIKYIDDLKINLLSGNPIFVHNPTHVEKKYINLVSLVDWVPERCSRLQNYLNQSKVDVVTSLCVLNSLSYSFTKANLYFRYDFADFQERLKILRANYIFFKDSNHELIYLIKKAIQLCNNFFDEYLFFLKQTQVFSGSPPKVSNYLDLYLKKQIGFNSLGCLVNLPYEYYYHFLTYSLLDNCLSNRMKKRFQNDTQFFTENIPFNNHYQNAQRKKISICSYNATYLLRNKINKGLIRFGYLI